MKLSGEKLGMRTNAKAKIYILLTLLLVILWPIKSAAVGFAITQSGYSEANNPQPVAPNVFGLGWISDVAWSSDGSLLALAGASGVWLFDAKVLEGSPRVLLNHPEGVLSIAFDPNGSFLVSGGSDGKIRLWDTYTGKLVSVLEGHSDRVRSIAYSIGSDVIASGSDDGTIRLWDIQKRSQISLLAEHEGSVSRVSLSPDGLHLASTTENADGVKIWDIPSKRLLSTLKCPQLFDTSAVLFNPQGNLTASCKDAEIKVWDAETGEVLNIYNSYGRATSLDYSPDGTRLASGNDQGAIELWNALTGEHQITLQTGYPHEVFGVIFNPNGSRLASVGNDQDIQFRGGPDWEVYKGKTVQIWDVNAGEIQETLEGMTQVMSVAFSSDGEYLASGGYDNLVHLWDTATGNELAILRGHSGPITCVAFNSNGELLASGSDDGTIRLWDIQSSEDKAVLFFEGQVRSIAFSPNGTLLLAGGYVLGVGGAVNLWDVSTLERLDYIEFPWKVNSVAWNKDSTYWAVGTSMVGLLPAIDVPGQRHYFDEDGNYWAVGSVSTAPIEANTPWHKHYLEMGDKFTVTDVNVVAFGSNGTLLAAGVYLQSTTGRILRQIQLWDTNTGERLNIIDIGIQINSIAFDPNGSMLAIGGHGNMSEIMSVSTLQLRDAVTGDLLRNLEGHADPVSGIVFSSDGEYLASASYDGTVRLWRLQ